MWRPTARRRAYLGELRPGVCVRLRVHLDVHDVGLALGVGDEGVLTRVPVVVQQLRLAGGTRRDPLRDSILSATGLRVDLMSWFKHYPLHYFIYCTLVLGPIVLVFLFVTKNKTKMKHEVTAKT